MPEMGLTAPLCTASRTSCFVVAVRCRQAGRDPSRASPGARVNYILLQDVSHVEAPLELIGTTFSPFVRRVAVSLNALEIPFDFQPLYVFKEPEKVRAHNPVVRIPTLLWRTAMCWSKATPSWMRSTGWSAPSGPHTGIRQAEAQGDEDDGDCPGLDREGAVGLLRTPIPAVGESASAVDRAQRRLGDRRVGVP